MKKNIKNKELKKTVRKIKKKNAFYYLNQKNLISEIKQGGGSLSITRLLLTYLAVIAGFIGTGLVFKLPPVGYMMIIGTGIFFSPLIILNSYKSSFQQKKFSEANKYIEKMLYYFEKSEKILVALEDIKKIFNGGVMYDSINASIDYIRNSSSSHVEENALKIIEENFPIKRIKTLHKFMLMVEYEIDGNSSLGIEMLGEERNYWVDRVLDFQQRKFFLKKSVILGLVFSAGICLFLLYLPIFTGLESLDISKNIITQISAAIFIMILIFIYYKFNEKLCKNWLDEDKPKTDEYYEKRYYKLINYNKRKEFNRSLIKSAIVMIFAAVIFLLTFSKVLLVIGIVISLFAYAESGIGYNILKKDIIKEINEVFPTWLLEVSLFMNIENVQISIFKSYETAPGILKTALKKLLQQLDNDPNSAMPYNMFLSELDVAEISEVMSSLYSLSVAAGGDFEEELKVIISRNYKLLNKAEQHKYNDKIAILNTYIIVPSLIVGVKLMVDMTILLISFLATGNSSMMNGGM